jgi:transposase
MEKSRGRKYMEMRRKFGVEMYKNGFNEFQVAEACGVKQPSVSRWVKAEREEGEDGLKSKPVPGRSRLDDAQKEELKKLVTKSPKEFGFEAELWTSPMVAILIKDQFGVSYHEGNVRKILRSLGLSSQKPIKRATQRDEEEIARWVKEEWPWIKKKA